MQQKNVVIKIGNSDDFFSRIKQVCKKIDNNDLVQSAQIMTFEDYDELTKFLISKKIEHTDSNIWQI